MGDGPARRPHLIASFPRRRSPSSGRPLLPQLGYTTRCRLVCPTAAARHQNFLCPATEFSPVDRHRQKTVGRQSFDCVVTSLLCCRSAADSFIGGTVEDCTDEDGARADVVRGGFDRREAQDVPVLRCRQLHTDDNDGP